MPLPSRGIGLVPVDVAERPRGVDNPLDAASKPDAVSGVLGPHRLQDREDVGGGDLIDRLVARSARSTGSASGSIASDV